VPRPARLASSVLGFLHRHDRLLWGLHSLWALALGIVVMWAGARNYAWLRVTIFHLTFLWIASLFVPALVYAGQPIGIGVRDVLSATGPQMISALVAVAFGLAMQQLFLLDLSGLGRLVVSVPICLVMYLVVVLGVFRMTGPLKLASSMLQDFGPLKRWA
jgi:hypothetical protein